MISDQDVIYITKKQASIALVSLAIFSILIFMLGYFWGKQCILDSFGQRIAQESMNDQIDYESMLQSFSDKNAFNASTMDDEKLNDKQEINLSNNNLENNLLDEKNDSIKDNQEVNSNELKEETNKTESPSSINSINQSKKYNASLISFCTKPSATAFVQRLQKHGILVNLKTRVSKSASGKIKKIWYQIVTNSYDSKDELESIIEQIKKLEHLKNSDIKIN